MKPIVLILSLILTISSYGQSTDGLFIDNNPKVTLPEAEWLNTNFKTENFDFRNKCVGFLNVESGGFYGIGKSAFPMQKKVLRNVNLSKISYRVMVLDAAEKKWTRGYDALILVASKKIDGKLSRVKWEQAMMFGKNRYPQIPADAGQDSNPNLSAANAIFFNELCKAELDPDTSVDFTGKKVAIFSVLCGTYSIEKISISEYVRIIKAQVSSEGYANPWWKYVLNEEQKQESGGYDIIIQTPCKKGVAIRTLIEHLKSEQQ